jgi:hypothetical protein
MKREESVVSSHESLEECRLIFLSNGKCPMTDGD